MIEAFRQTRTAAVIDREIKLKKSRKRGLSVSEMVESLLAMWAAGGERAEDLDQFRQDKALTLLLGHDLPAAQTARDFLAQFHAEDLPLLQDGKAPVAAETVPLLGLAKANAELVLTFLTYGESTVYGEGSLAKLKGISEAACCAPTCCEPEAILQAAPQPAAASACCTR